MDALDFFRVRYEQFHRPMWDELTTGLSGRELRGRPHPKANIIAWLFWNIARVEGRREPSSSPFNLAQSSMALRTVLELVNAACIALIAAR
jgi:hypothetical protein